MWLVIAVTANVGANLSLKQVARVVPMEVTLRAFVTLIGAAWFWVAMASAAVLLFAYVALIRTMHVGIAYAMVTALALTGMTIASHYLFGESLRGMQIAGIVFVGIGVALLVVSAGE